MKTKKSLVKNPAPKTVAQKTPASEEISIAKQCARFLKEKLAEEVQVLDLRGLSTASDIFVLANGRSSTHLAALYEQLDELMKKTGNPVHREGAQSVHWRLLDVRGVTVHLFSRWARRFYALDDLWVDAPKVRVS